MIVLEHASTLAVRSVGGGNAVPTKHPPAALPPPALTRKRCARAKAASVFALATTWAPQRSAWCPPCLPFVALLAALASSRRSSPRSRPDMRDGA